MTVYQRVSPRTRTRHLSVRFASSSKPRSTSAASIASSDSSGVGFGWAKTIGGMRKLKHRGLAKVDFQFTLTFAAYNLVRLRTLGVGG